MAAALVAVALALVGGCSGSSGDGRACTSWCGGLCEALDECDLSTPSDCQDQCSSGLSASACSDARPADQLTCAELAEVWACASYCATLCERASECGSFNAALCSSGCAEQGPSICNPASVEARSCDQLKPELRFYEDVARAAQNGNEVVSSSSGPRFGLCETADDCEEPLGCDTATNTCGACVSDLECHRDYQSYVCAEQACVEVECATDDDCLIGVCLSERNECGDCRSSADCSSSFFKACNSETAECVECTVDADCTSGTGTRCDTTSSRCSECLENADCTEASSSRCNTDLGYCSSCETDADCGHTDMPACGSFGCVECSADEHCTAAERPHCELGLERCVECSADEHCPSQNCDFFSNTCL